MPVIFVLIALGVYGYALYVCFLKGKHGFFWIGIAGLFPLLTPFLVWFPITGALRAAKEGSPWETRHRGGARPPDSDARDGGKAAAPGVDAIIGRFLASAEAAGVISEDVRTRLVAFRDDPSSAPRRASREPFELRWSDEITEAQAPAADVRRPSAPSRPGVPARPAVSHPPVSTQPSAVPPTRPDGSSDAGRPPGSLLPPVQPARHDDGGRRISAASAAPAAPPEPREPSVVALRIREMREAVSADVALHGFAYLGVLLTFVGVLGFLLFAFVDLPNSVQPVVELFIASVFFGWAFVLHRQEAHNVAKALELLGGAILPLILFAGLVDDAPIPPDVTGAGLIVVMPLVSLGIAYVYTRIARRRPETMLRHLVLPLVWLAALAAGFAFKTDEALVSDAITRLVAPQPALAAIAITVTLLPRIRKRLEARDLPVMFPALVATPAVYVLALGLSAGASGVVTLSATAAGVATLISVRLLSLHYGQERLALLAMPVLLAVAVVPAIPQVGLGVAGAVGAIGYLGLGTWFVQGQVDDRETWALAAAGLLAGLGMSLAQPGAALVAFAAASGWIGWRRVVGLPLGGTDQALLGATAVLPVGVGWALWQLLGAPGASLLMGVVLVGMSLATRWRGSSDAFWAWWPPAASAIVATFAIASVGLAQIVTIDTSGAVVLLALALLAIAIATGPRHTELRADAAILIVVLGTMPYLGVGWSAALGVAGVLAVLERLVRADRADAVAWAVGAILTIVGLLATFSLPWSAVVAFGSASVWIHWRRVAGLPLESVDELVNLAAGIFPLGFGWGIWFVMPTEAAAILLSGFVTLLAVTVRVRRVEDPFWQWWPIGPALIVVVLATAPIGLGRIETISSAQVASTLSFAFAAVTVVLGRGHEQARRSIATALVVVATAPYVGAGWAGAIGTAVFIVLIESIIRSTEREELGSVLSVVGFFAGLGVTFIDPAAALPAFLLASLWLHWRRSAGVPVDGVEDMVMLAAAIVPVGLGWALWQVLDSAPAVLIMASVVAATAGVARWRNDDDVFWQWWPGAAAVVVGAVSVGVIGVPPTPPLDAHTWFVLVTLGLAAATLALGTGFFVGRSWGVVAILLLDLQLLLDAAAASPTVRASAWSLLGLGLVAVAALWTHERVDHLAAMGHLVAGGAVVLALGSTGRVIALVSWSLGLMVAVGSDRFGRGSAPRLLRRLASATAGASIVGWVAPVLLVASVPITVLMSLNLWDTFTDNRAWSGLATGGTAVLFAAVGRIVSWPREVRRSLTISASVYVVVGVAVAAPVPWPSITAAAMSIAVAALVAPTIRNSALSWFAWLMSGVMFALLGERAGLDADGVRLLVLAIAVVYFVGGLVADDRLAGRRIPGDGLRVGWLRFPVLLGALAVPGTLGSIMALEPSAAPFAALAAAAGYFGVAWLLRSALVTVPAYGLAAFAVAALAPVGPADAPLLLPGLVAALLAVSLAARMFGASMDTPWEAWDTPPLLVAHGVGLLGLGLSALDTTPMPWIVLGGLSGAVGVWRRVRYWIDAGHVLVVVGAAFVGIGAVALALALTSVRAMYEASRLDGWRRLVAHAVATLAAGSAWVLTVEWAGWTIDAATSLTGLVFGAAAVATGVLAARLRIRQDAAASWILFGGLGVAYSTATALITGPGEGSALLLSGPAVGVVLLATAVQIARVSLEEIAGYMPVAIGGLAWPVLAVFADWDLGAALIVTAWLGGLSVATAGESARRGLLSRRSTGYAWGVLGLLYLISVLVGVVDGPSRSLWATAIAVGAALMALGTARAASTFEDLPLPHASLGTLLGAIAALTYGLETGAGGFVIANVIASTGGSLLLLRLGRDRNEVSRWAPAVGGFVVLSSAIALAAAVSLLDDVRPLTAVLLVVGLQAALVGIVWQRGEILTAAPAAIGAAVLLLVAESATGVVEWYTLPVALVLLAEIELIGRYPIGRRDDAAAPNLMWAEWFAIALGVLPGVVDMFVRSLASSFLVFGFAALLLVWAVLTRVRRRAVAAAAVAVAAAVLVIAAALAGAAPESSIFWIIAVGLGFAVMSVAGVVEAMRSRRGFVVRRFDELMGGWR